MLSIKQCIAKIVAFSASAGATPFERNALTDPKQWKRLKTQKRYGCKLGTWRVFENLEITAECERKYPEFAGRAKWTLLVNAFATKFDCALFIDNKYIAQAFPIREPDEPDLPWASIDLIMTDAAWTLRFFTECAEEKAKRTARREAKRETQAVPSQA